jgi:putative salt-induced outer membrane protein
VKRFLVVFFGLLLSAAGFAEETGASPFADTGAWDNESELGIVAASGNTRSQTYQVKQSTTYKWTANVLRFSGHYLYGTANGTENARNWDINARYERELNDRISLYAGHGWDGDKFIGFDYRTSLEAGGKYYLIAGDKKSNYLATEAGYRFSSEHRVAPTTPSTLQSHFLRAYAEGVKSLTDSASAKAWVELLPDLANAGNLQLNFEASLSVMLSRVFSLKVAYGGKYRQTPIVAGNKNYDSLFLTGLVAKF